MHNRTREEENKRQQREFVCTKNCVARFVTHEKESMYKRNAATKKKEEEKKKQQTRHSARSFTRQHSHFLFQIYSISVFSSVLCCHSANICLSNCQNECEKSYKHTNSVRMRSFQLESTTGNRYSVGTVNC